MKETRREREIDQETLKRISIVESYFREKYQTLTRPIEESRRTRTEDHTPTITYRP